jgi:DNA-binding response OmpR family regulator
VLVADDQEDIRALMLATLRRAGFAVALARDGAEALELAQERRPDIALLDVSMPRMSGHEAVLAMRADPALAGVPILLVSASTTEADREEGMRIGADGFVPKPFSPQALAARVREMLEASC